MNSSNKSSRKSSRRSSRKGRSKVLQEITFLKEEVKKLKEENKTLDSHIDALYNDNNNMVAQVDELDSRVVSSEGEIILIKKTMKEKLNINWRRVD